MAQLHTIRAFVARFPALKIRMAREGGPACLLVSLGRTNGPHQDSDLTGSSGPTVLLEISCRKIHAGVVAWAFEINDDAVHRLATSISRETRISQADLQPH